MEKFTTKLTQKTGIKYIIGSTQQEVDYPATNMSKLEVSGNDGVQRCASARQMCA